ncbi:MAG: putative lipid II flippase FtsW [Oscillospiraceae bacterium]|nr:putative lipid II flippase FtsW [Oscillospiraceae bacterium]
MNRTVTGNRKSSRRGASRENNAKSGGIIRFVNGDIDYTFLAIVIVMLSFGLIMILSASAPTARTKFDNPYYLFTKQLATSLIGIAAMIFMSKVDYNIFKKFTNAAVVFSTVLLIAVLIPGIGTLYNGARRWIEIGPIQIQPSEFMKLSIIMYIAKLSDNNPDSLTKMSGIFRCLFWIGLTVGLMSLETHMSGAVVIMSVGVLLMIVAGTPVYKIAFIFGPLGAAACAFILAKSPGRVARIMNFHDPFTDVQNTGWQVIQSLYAIGSGGIFGLGIGNSRQKYSYLPEPYNDFIFSVICEECGFFGAVIVIALFIMLMIRGMKIAQEAPDRFSSLMVTGIIIHVMIQAILNIAVATSSIPNTGMSLPFFSFGGTAIVILMAEMGIILSISRVSKRRKI